MSLTPNSKHLFQVDGLLVAVRCLVAQYKLDYEPIGKEPFTAYSLFKERGCKELIGKACITDQGIEVKFNRSVRDILIEKGFPVEHPESEASEAGFTDGMDFASIPSWVVGNFTVETSDFGFTILRGGV